MKRVSKSAIDDLEAKDKEIRSVVEAKVYLAAGTLNALAIIQATRDPEIPELKDALMEVLQVPKEFDQARQAFQDMSDRFNLGVAFLQAGSPDQLLSSLASTEESFRRRYAKISQQLAFDDDLNNTLIQRATGEIYSGMLQQYMSSHGYKFDEGSSKFVISP
jgi:hypothetical protein